MKNNVKRMASVGALGLALLSNLSMGAFAAEADNTPNVESESMKAILVQSDGSGKYQVSNDGGENWENGIPATPTTDSVEIPFLTKEDEKTGEMLYSVDNGATWNPLTEMADLSADGQLPGDAITVKTDAVLMSKYDEETGKTLVSADGGETWEEADPSQAMPLTPTFHGEGENTGDIMITVTHATPAESK